VKKRDKGKKDEINQGSPIERACAERCRHYVLDREHERCASERGVSYKADIVRRENKGESWVRKN